MVGDYKNVSCGLMKHSICKAKGLMNFHYSIGSKLHQVFGNYIGSTIKISKLKVKAKLCFWKAIIFKMTKLKALSSIGEPKQQLKLLTKLIYTYTSTKYVSMIWLVQ